MQDAARKAFSPSVAVSTSRSELAAAQELLDGLPAEALGHRYAALMGRIELATLRPAGDPAVLAAKVAADPRDFESRFALAALLAHAGDWPAAFDQLLETVLRDKGDAREQARKQLVEWFEVCPDPAAVSRGRRYLGMYLN
jgi:putative thioredoxin